MKKGSKVRVLQALISVLFGAALYKTITTPSSGVWLRALSTPNNAAAAASFYQPAPAESFLMSHMSELQMTAKAPSTVATCTIWKDELATPFFKELHAFVKELKDYYQRLKSFQLDPSIKDLRRSIRIDKDHSVCQKVELHPEGLPAIFRESGQLSHSKSMGYVEPLLPPMRHPDLCSEKYVGTQTEKKVILMSLQYLVHDWGAICRQLKPHSRTVFVDMGASLVFHADANLPSPSIYLMEQYQRFGILFDHIYAYELKPTPPALVFEHLPEQFRSAFHWINVGVNPEPKHMHNPFQLLLDNFNEDDLIIVKLDIDTPEVERKLADELESTPALLKMIDHFYFEYHVNQLELGWAWGPSKYSVQESFELFSALRQKGVSAHFWV